MAPATKSGMDLASLPPLERPVPISVFDFPDLSGANKPNDKFAEFSKAVTQGGLPLLVDAMKRACMAQCFRVIERQALRNVLQERSLIQSTRAEYQGKGASRLPALQFAGVLIEGGIIAYETNTMTGGAGARFLGIGGNASYKQDIVTISLRLVSVQTGEVLKSISTTKTIYSVAGQGSEYKFVATDAILEIEAGLTRNEPAQLAVRQAIELGVYALIMEGAIDHHWKFSDPSAGERAIALYLKRRGREKEIAQSGKGSPNGSADGSVDTSPVGSIGKSHSSVMLDDADATASTIVPSTDDAPQKTNKKPVQKPKPSSRGNKPAASTLHAPFALPPVQASANGRAEAPPVPAASPLAGQFAASGSAAKPDAGVVQNLTPQQQIIADSLRQQYNLGR